MEELQLETQALIYAADDDGIQRACEFFKVDFSGKKSLSTVKGLCSALEEQLLKLKEGERESYLQDVSEMLKKPKSTKKTTQPEVKVENKEELNTLLASASALRRQFKINGQVGEPGQKDKVSFTSLVRQMTNGQMQGYSECEIVDGVIRAITPGLVLRNYLETYKDLPLDQLKKILRSHYGVKNTAELYQNLAAICQEYKEPPQAFLMRALDLRQQILFSCYEGGDEDGLQYDPSHIQCLFLRSVETGLQDESIRAKMRPFLKDPKVTDETLIQQMSMAHSVESERMKKLKGQVKTKANSPSVSAVAESDPKGNLNDKESELLAAIKSLKAEVESIKSSIKSSTPVSENNPRPQQRGPPLCSVCREEGKQSCRHCFKCGSESHLARKCDQGNGQRLPPRARR